MRILVKAKTGAKEERVEKTGEGEFKVAVKERPIEGKANEAIIKALAGYFKVTKSEIVLVSGHTAKQKIFEIFI